MILVLGICTAVTLANIALRHQLMVLQRSIPRGSAARTASSGFAFHGSGRTGGPASSLSSPPLLSLGTAKAFDFTGAGSPDDAHQYLPCRFACSSAL
jgi:hypothetical protein